MRLPIMFYKSSILATFFGTLGCVLLICAPLVMLEESFSDGLVPLIIGTIFSLLAYWLGKRAEFRKWLKRLKKSGELDDIESSLETAVKLYSLNPCKRTLKYIKSKNRSAAEHITSELKKQEEAKKR